MEIKTIEGATRVFDAPANWDQEANGACLPLTVRDELIDGVPFMVSAHQPTAAELQRLQQGAPVYLGISANVHPVIFLSVGEMQTEAAADDEPSKVRKVDYTALSSDLRALAQQRVSDAIRSVLQLCQTADEAVVVNLAILTTMGAAAAGSFAKHQGYGVDDMPISKLLPALFEAMEEATAEAEARQ